MKRSNLNAITIIGLLSLSLAFTIYYSLFIKGKVVYSDYTNIESRNYQLPVKDLENRYSEWLKSFRAFDATHQQWCFDFLDGKKDGMSEYGQDMITFFNIFKYWPMQGKKGFYLESGAQDPEWGSNTFFYDRCLGWDGICVEPDPKYVKEFREKRSCKHISGCIGGIRHVVSFDEGFGAPNPNGSIKITCDTLENMLLEYHQKSPTRHDHFHIDFWSLDIEGYEMSVLNSIDFKKITIPVILIEDFWVSSRDLDLFMYVRGYKKAMQLHVDALYVYNENPYKLPDKWDEWLEITQGYRRKDKNRLIA